MSSELLSHPGPEPDEAKSASATLESAHPPTPSDLLRDSEIVELDRTESQVDRPTLMTLAAEIRVKILAYLLLSDQPLQIYCPSYFICSGTRHRHLNDRSIHKPEQSYSLYPEILRVNRCLYGEGKAVLYGKNTMSIRVLSRNQMEARPRDEILVTMLDHANVLQTEENRRHHDSRPLAPPEAFHNFHIFIQLEQNHHPGRLKSTLLELVMNLNRYFPSGKPRALMLRFHQLRGGFCDACDLDIEKCDEADHLFQQNKDKTSSGGLVRLRCRGLHNRQKESAKNAAQVFRPFEFLRDVTNVEYESVLPNNAHELSRRIKDPQKGPDLFPLYWATLCWIQRVPDDPYTRKIGYSWVGREDDLWDDNDSDTGSPNSSKPGKDEFRLGPSTAHWKCADWLVGRMRQLRSSMEAADEVRFRKRRSAIRCLVNSVLKDVQDRLIYMFEDLRPSPEDVQDEEEWNATEFEPPKQWDEL